MERRIEVFSNHEIQEGNFEILHGLVLLLVSKGMIQPEELKTMCSCAKTRLASGAAVVEGHMASAYIDLFLHTIQKDQAALGKTQ